VVARTCRTGRRADAGRHGSPALPTGTWIDNPDSEEVAH